MQKIYIKGWFNQLNKKNKLNINSSQILAPWAYNKSTDLVSFFKQLNKNITIDEIMANCSEKGQFKIEHGLHQIIAYVEIDNSCASKQDILNLL